jgi:glycosyltransferase involved in cell wall biosynthesis
MTRTRRVVMTTRYPLHHPGGVESVARALVDCLGRSSDGWRLSHVAAYSGRTGAARIPLIGDLVAAIRLASRLFGRGDILIVHGAEYAWAPLMVARLTRTPVVAVWHGVRASETIEPRFGRAGKAAKGLYLWSQDLLLWLALRADATVAVSPTVATDLKSRYGFRGEVAVIPNGVALKAGRPGDEGRSAVAAGGDALRVIWVGTCAYKKGLDLALAACRLARGRGRNVSLTVVGVPVESVDLESASDEEWLTRLGPVPPGEMEALYRRHDLMLFPTRYEACPMVVLEALSEGLPVIGSNVVRWLIEGAGEVVADGDARSYANALDALADPERRRRLAGVALERARAFTWESSAARYSEVLSVVDGRSRPGRG